MKNISIDLVLNLHQKTIELHGGIYGIKNKDALISALENPFATFDGVELYPTITSKISIMTYSVINNHPMHDGNKRLGIGLMLVLLKKNNIQIKYTQKELIDLGLSIAKNECKTKDINKWIEEHIV